MKYDYFHLQDSFKLFRQNLNNNYKKYFVAAVVVVVAAAAASDLSSTGQMQSWLALHQ